MIELVVPVVVAVIGALAIVCSPLALAVYQHRTLKGRLDHQDSKLEEVRENVSNDHSTNLRDDVDDLAVAVAAALAGVDRIEAFQSATGAASQQLRVDVGAALGRQREHEAASALLVGALRDSDRRILDELRRHHPQVPDYDDLTAERGRVVDLDAEGS